MNCPINERTDSIAPRAADTILDIAETIAPVIHDKGEGGGLTCSDAPAPPVAMPGYPETVAKYTILYDTK
jgi:hypothetical protein